jgi:hypothetical protein
LGGGPPGFTRGFTSLALLWYASITGPCFCRLRDFHPLWWAFPGPLARNGFVTPRGARNPGPKTGLGLLRFRSPLLTESMSLSFPAGTEMFQFPAFALPALCIQAGVTEGCSAGFPHSDISGSMLVCQLPGAYRRLPRLSSPLDAKTSTMHPSELDHIYRSPSCQRSQSSGLRTAAHALTRPNRLALRHRRIHKCINRSKA